MSGLLEGVKMSEGPGGGKENKRNDPVSPIKGQINVTGLKF